MIENALDVEKHDAEMADEIRLVTALIVVANMAPGELEQAVIDDTLGVEAELPFLPTQRPGD